MSYTQLKLLGILKYTIFIVVGTYSLVKSLK